jgi:subfamily B ATP-binding cassette protein MsbA
VATVLVLIASVLQGVPVFLVRWTLNDILVQGGNPAPLAIGVVALYALNGLVNFARASITRSVAWRVVTELRGKLHDQLLRQDLAWHLRTPSGERQSRLLGDINTLQYAVNGVVTAVQKPVTLLVLIGSAFVTNPKLALIAFGLLPLAAFPIHRVGQWVRRASRAASDAAAALSAHAQQTLTGMRVVLISGGEEDRSRAFRRLDEAHEAAQVEALTAQLLPAPLTELVAAVGVGAVLWVGGMEVAAGKTAAGDLVGFLVALAVMNQPLRGLSEVGSLMQRSLAAADTVFGLMDRAPEIVSGTEPVVAPKNIEFVSVTLDYGAGPVLEDVSLRLRSGERVALVGPSGGGKTSLLSLIPRLYDPSSGHILWDGRDARSLRLSELRRHIAVVSQETFLFDDTVAANIAFGVADATPAAIVDAAISANADGFIRELPDGYDTRIHELGMRLSGGQRQRICIARAILRNAAVLLLDEATSNLDAQSEAAVQEALDRLMVGRTTLVVAHRLSTVRNADRIVYMESGRVVEAGTHEELVAAGGAYRSLLGAGLS